MAKLNQYLHFDGNASEAFEFYKSVFGGEYSMIARYKDMPPGVPAPEGKDAERIMHVSLPVGENSVLMGSDRPSTYANGTRGDLSYIYIEAETKDEATKLFSALVAGGQEHMPIADTFWGSYFGMLADKFGVQWMISYSYPPA